MYSVNKNFSQVVRALKNTNSEKKKKEVQAIFIIFVLFPDIDSFIPSLSPFFFAIIIILSRLGLYFFWKKFIET